MAKKIEDVAEDVAVAGDKLADSVIGTWKKGSKSYGKLLGEKSEE